MSLSNTITTETTPKKSQSLKVPNPSPNVKINDPEFEKLTAAEKLNDPNYREIVYQTYPNEPTCACPSEVNFSSVKSDIEKSSNTFILCRSGCKKSCCSSVRQQGVASSQQHNANKDDKVPPAPFMHTYCVGSPRSNVYDEDRTKKTYNGSYCGVENRLRGGGEGRIEEGMYSQSGEVNQEMVRSFGDAWNGRNGCVVNRHREGGGGGGIGYEYVERYPVNMSLGFDTSTRCNNEENFPRGYPRPRHMEHPQDSHHDTSYLRASLDTCTTKPSGPVAPGCCCPGKEMFPRTKRTRRNGEDCVKKPCLSVDCLIKTFRETQEFVESFGKVQGLAGLGLMDPAESPYFGRDKIKDCNSEAIRCTTATSGLSRIPNKQCTGPCNQEMMRCALAGVGPYPEASPFTIAVPGRGGVVREAVPSMPGPEVRYPPGKSRKGLDKEKLKEGDVGNVPLGEIKTGPCREPKCKSKRRVENDEEVIPPVETSEDPMKKPHAKINGRKISRGMGKVKGGSKMRSGHRSSEPGPGGDQMRESITSRKSGRRLMRFVYSVGDTNSSFTCGHKHCVEERRRVPWNMGWLWNLNQTIGTQAKPRIGWKPGAIARHVGEILREAKAKLLLNHKATSKTRSVSSTRSRPRSTPSRGKRTKIKKSERSVRRASTKKEDDDKEDLEPPPTLYINRKNGTYYVTMHPIKQETMDVPKLEEPMKPLQLKITKNRDDASVATSSTASDMEIEFSPPPACNRYCKKPNVIHVDTQVKQQEIIAAFKQDEGVKKEKKKEKKKKEKKKKKGKK